MIVLIRCSEGGYIILILHYYQDNVAASPWSSGDWNYRVIFQTTSQNYNKLPLKVKLSGKQR